MKKFFGTVFAGMGLALVLTSPAQAGNVGDRAFFSGGTNCVGYWTNNFKYAAIDLKRLRVEKSLTATNVVTFVRITQSDTNYVFTNAIGAVTCASGVGVQATLTATCLKYGDIVRATGIDAATGSASNTFLPWLEFEVQEH